MLRVISGLPVPVLALVLVLHDEQNTVPVAATAGCSVLSIMLQWKAWAYFVFE
jgi:hypothetical protein